MELTLIGDLHGNTQIYKYIDLSIPSIQLGDIGIGFPKVSLPTLPKEHRFIRGNHDNPEICKTHPNYLGDFGYIEEWDLFYVSGAATPMWAMSKFTPGFDWWPEEQLSLPVANEAYKLYVESKPRIVLSHAAPQSAKIAIMSKQGYVPNEVSHTETLLQNMFEEHQPSQWFFGHHHFPCHFKIKKTYFRCLGIIEDITIDV